MEQSKDKLQVSPKRKYSLAIQIITSIFALLYVVFFIFSFIPSPEGSPIADHPYTPWDIEMILVKGLFIIFMIGFYYSWKSRIVSGVIYLLWCGALFWDCVYIGNLLHVSGDAILFGVPIFIIGIILLITGLIQRNKLNQVVNIKTIL
ncbi:MAG: hypothetical protein IT212_04195 [Bacteroidia bacterium]|nr:hypothetical protein [Bacteroidia bacterium]